ncbi:MAG: hypothetical protein MUE70_14175 [Desulfobacterales bacterium]|jgi:hypothetical protein|nr:hypothetical protein [Desulfobacterales bacterium]
MNQTLDKAVEAYGGREKWAKAKSIEAEISANGLAFILKRRPPFNRARFVMDVSRPYSRIKPIGEKPEITGVLDGSDVYLENANSETIQERKDARQYFPGGRRFFYWDDLDMAYFANYATWNYLTLPALLMRPDIIWKELETGLLEAVFPDNIPTHCRVQRFRFDRGTGLLVQHDYTAEVISSLAKAAHVVLDHSESEGFQYTSHRRVTPRSFTGKPLPLPTLIEIIVHDFHVND